jgi:hypothetical protein
MPLRGVAADVVRIVEGVTGRVPMTMTLRFDYGHVMPWVRRLDDGLSAIAVPDAVWLQTPVATHGKDLSTVSDFEVSAGHRVPFVLTHRLTSSATRAGRPAGRAEQDRAMVEPMNGRPREPCVTRRTGS